MAYNILSIANLFIDYGVRVGNPCTAPKLHKLIYISHGWHLAILGKSLVGESYTVGKYGPFNEKLFDKIKHNGSESPITDLLYYYDNKFNKQYYEIPNTNEIKNLVDAIWDNYSYLNNQQLMDCIIDSETPWRKIYNKYNGFVPKGTIILNEDISNYYKQLIKKD